MKLSGRKINRLVLPNLDLVAHWVNRYQGKGLDRPDLIGAGNLSLVEAAGSYKSRYRTGFRQYAAQEIRRTLAYNVKDARAQAGLAAARRIGIGPEERMIDRQRLEQCAGRGLSRREEETIYQRLVLGLTLEEVGEKLKVSDKRVGQIQTAALRKLRSAAPKPPARPRKIKAAPEPVALSLHDIVKVVAAGSEDVRNISLYLARKLQPYLSHEEIGAPFQLQHSVVVAGINSIAGRCAKDAGFRAYIEGLLARLRAGLPG